MIIPINSNHLINARESFNSSFISHDTIDKEELNLQATPKIWVTHATTKVFQAQSAEESLYTVPETSSDIDLSIAKNGIDFFQLIVSAGSSAISDVMISYGDLSDGNGNSISKDNIALYLEYYVNVRTDTWYESVVEYEFGFYPDALIPLSKPFDVVVNHNQPIWVEIQVPSNTASGEYSGEITLTGGISGTVTLAIEVLNFSVPSKSGLFNPADLDYWELWELGDPSELEFQTAVKEYTEFFVEREILPTDSMDPLEELPTLSDGKWNFDDWYEGIEFFLDTTMANSLDPLVLRVPANFEIIGIDEDEAASESSQNKYTDFLGEFKTFIKAKSSLPTTVWYVWIDELDEPDENIMAWQIAKYAELTASVNAKDDEFYIEYRIDGTIDWDSGFAEIDLEKDTSDWVDLSDKFTMWIAPTEDFDFGLDYIKKAVSDNRKVMIYQQAWTALPSGDEDIPEFAEDRDYEYPSLSGLVNPALFSRILPWFVWKYDLIGIGFWAAMAWYNAEKDVMIDPFVDDPALIIAEDLQSQNGDGFLIYPGKYISKHSDQLDISGPVSSLRLELFRKGLEDFKYLSLLDRNLVNFSSSTKLQAENLLDTISTQLATVSSFDRDVALYDNKLDEVKKFLNENFDKLTISPITISWNSIWSPVSITKDAPVPEDDAGSLLLLEFITAYLILLTINRKRKK